MTDLRSRFCRVVVGAEGGILTGRGMVVATSGGLDSMALLHLLRFAAPTAAHPIHIAHFDHHMREGSPGDAQWVQGVARAWGLPVVLGGTDAPLRSEESARNARYQFLEGVRREVGADVVVTGHHADDQAETVLFRLLRGSGTVGLAGMAEFREPGIWRPMLPFWREEILEYGLGVGLAWREDPSNSSLDFARNVLRTRIIPEMESAVAPGARRSLVRFAEHARGDVEAWQYVMPGIMETLGLEQDGESISLDQKALRRLPPPLCGRVLRALSERLGVRLDAVGTRLAAEFTSSSQSGRRMNLTGGLVLTRQLDRVLLVLEGPVREGGGGGGEGGGETEAGPEESLRIPGAQAGSGRVTLGGRMIRVRWGGPELSSEARESTVVRAPHFPLMVRARRAGDRIQLPYGSKKLKKLLLEERIPEGQRGRLPVLVDARGAVLWIPGVATAVGSEAAQDARPVLHIGLD
ncbi:MAG TPA: tRNA lysidine(34) synthetase TilS [Gemmatimonadetes bacterium]|nr:tRNA lysidine(34) synthetase TilS [Gemmatimonadota bacterium]